MLNPRLAAVVATALALPFCALAEEPLPAQARASLAKATDYLTSISTEGGYLWRYTSNLKQRWGEGRATTTQIWVQPPGTPAVGMAFLDAYRATRDPRHLNAAQAAAMALVRGQLESGGWAYLVEFKPAKRSGWAYRVDAKKHQGDHRSRKNTTTFDDNNTQSSLRFLMAFLDAATNRPSADVNRIRDALNYGLAKMIEAQYPNGAWPQRWDGDPYDVAKYPVQEAHIPSKWQHTWPHTKYAAYYTLNDDAQLDCIETMLDAYHRLGDSKYLDAAKRGGDFLILAQLPEPQPGWAQQYNFKMEPDWARAFEPPAVCSRESAVAMGTLVDLYVETGDQKYLDPIPPFLTWLKRSELAPNLWSRLYELGSNKPIYGDRDGEIHYTLAEISAERRQGYSWQSAYGIPEIIRHYEEVLSKGRDAVRNARQSSERIPTPSKSRVAHLLSQQDKNGRWTSNGMVEMRQFIRNMRVLSAFAASR